MSKCRVCKEREAATGYKGKCLVCGRLYMKQWRDRNKDKVKTNSKRWYERHGKERDYHNSAYLLENVPNRKVGLVEVCRTMNRHKVSTSKECADCGKMACEIHEGVDGDIWLCRVCHAGRHLK